MPISMGKNSAPTNNGTYIVGDRFGHMVMDSSTYGVPSNSPNGYRTEVDYATQISYSGIFVHAAPWSVGSQGYSNVSHGCLNVSTSNAQWFFDNTKRGDIVEISNTVGSILPGVDGLALARMLRARETQSGKVRMPLIGISARSAGNEEALTGLAMLYSDSRVTSAALQKAGVTLYDLRRHLQAAAKPSFAGDPRSAPPRDAHASSTS